MQIDIIRNSNFPTYQSYKEFIEKYGYNGEYIAFASQKEENMNGQKVMVQLDGKAPYYKAKFSYAYLVYNGNIIEIYLLSAENNDALFNQILSTFKFTH